MHYRSTAFSRNGQPTILPINPSVPASDLGQLRALTASDIRHAQTLYCGGGKIVVTSNSVYYNIMRSKKQLCSQPCIDNKRIRFSDYNYL